MKAILVIGAVVAVLFLAPFLIPVPELENTVDPSLLAEEDSRFVQLENVRLHYKLYGEGNPSMILLHGFGASVFSWREVIGPLSEKFKVLAFDRPGFGLTSRPLGEELLRFNPYTIQGQVELTVELMDHLGLDKVVLVGNSAGGLTAMAVALAHPERVVGLVMVDAAIYTNNEDSSLFKLLALTPQGKHLGPLLARTLLSRADDLLELAWYDPSKITPEMVAGYEKPLRSDDWDKALWELTLARDEFDTEQLKRMDIPTLVLSGDSDKIVPVEEARRLARELPNASLYIFDRTGHLPQEENPREFLRVVTTFIQSLKD